MNTHLRLVILTLLAFTLSLFTAQAAVEITETAITLDVNYGEFNTEDQKVISKTAQITVRNTENTAVTVQTVVTGLPSTYGVPMISTVNIPAGQSRTVNFEVKVPHLENSGLKDIGTITIKDSSSNTQYDTVVLRQNTKPMLRIDELKAEYDDKDGSSQVDTFDGSTNIWRLDKGIRPGSEVILTLKSIENLFDKDYDQDNSDIEDIIIKIDPSDSDLFKGSFEEEYDLGTLAAEDEEDLEIRFVVDEEVKDDEYSFDFEIEGEDGNGAKHSFTKELNFKIERNKDDVRVSKFEITPASLETCSKVLIDVEIKNLGTKKQDKAALQLFSESLGIIENIPSITLNRYSDDTNSFRKTFSYDFAKKKVLPGKYNLDLSSFIDIDERTDLQRKQLDVKMCGSDDQADKNREEGSLSTNAEDEAGTEPIIKVNESKISSGKIVQTIEDPYTSEDVLVSLIIVSIILILAVIAIFIVILIKDIKEWGKQKWK